MLVKCDAKELDGNVFSRIGEQWMLITAGTGAQCNTMTASWGGVGILWNKPVTYVFLRPQRFTRELLDGSELFSVCFLPEDYRKQLSYCGAHSGRDGDKLAACGFSALHLDGAPVLAQSQTALTCRKLFCQQLDPAGFIDTSLDAANYPQKDYHFLYVSEILGAYLF